MMIYEMNKENTCVTITLSTEEFNSYFTECADCGELILKKEAVLIDGEYYCMNCTTTCHECGRRILLEEACRTVDSDYDYCPRCFESETYCCSSCGDRFRYEDELHETDDGWYCDRCYEDHRPLIKSYHTQKEYSDIVFYGDADRRQHLHIGIELEVDANHRVNREQIAKELKGKFDSFMAYEFDSSLTYGFEVISQPATLQYHLDMMPTYRSAFHLLADSGMKAHDIGTCGFHCHLDRRYFGKKEDSSIAKMLFLFEKFRPELMRFSRRTEDQVSNWCRSRKQHYDGTAGWIKRAVVDSKYSYNYQNRYYSLNLTNSETIEIRLWRGTINSETFEATLKFTERLAELCKHTRAVDLAKLTFDDILGNDPVIHSYWNRVNG